MLNDSQTLALLLALAAAAMLTIAWAVATINQPDPVFVRRFGAWLDAHTPGQTHDAAGRRL